MESNRFVAICGLPGSGKTTFLAALWHLLTAGEIQTRLKLVSLAKGDRTHLNLIAEHWRDGKEQDRTRMEASRVVKMDVLGSDSEQVSLSFPDVSGELFRQIWEERVCEQGLAGQLQNADGLILFVHADAIESPTWIVDIAALSKKLGVEVEPGQAIEWVPRISPTQVQLVDLLQLMSSPELAIRTRRLAVLLSAWDKVRIDGLSPSKFLATHLPLLSQYLSQGSDGWNWSAFGVSAQGSDYEGELDLEPTERENLLAIREMDQSSKRIQLVSESGVTHDLTEAVAWLLK